MKYQLCKCNNCGTILIDENPSKQPKFNPPRNTQEMLWTKDKETGDIIWACPNVIQIVI